MAYRGIYKRSRISKTTNKNGRRKKLELIKLNETSSMPTVRYIIEEKQKPTAAAAALLLGQHDLVLEL
jgi:hypothetical protein